MVSPISYPSCVLKFFESNGHEVIPSAPVVPENDPTCLFNTAGMQPLIPYLKGQPHPYGTRLCDYQKCVRTNDLDNIGDTYHHTFFEMLGNWSLGDYFKDEAIEWSFEFLTQVLNIPVERFSGIASSFALSSGVMPSPSTPSCVTLGYSSDKHTCSLSLSVNR